MIKLIFVSFDYSIQVGFVKIVANGWAMVSLWNCPRGLFRENQAIIAR